MPVSDADINATIANLTRIVADMVRLQRLSGARPGEITAIRPMDVDRSLQVWAYRPDAHKTEHHERHRVIFFGPKAQKILSSYLDRAADKFCFSPQESEELRRSQARKRRRRIRTKAIDVDVQNLMQNAGLRNDTRQAAIDVRFKELAQKQESPSRLPIRFATRRGRRFERNMGLIPYPSLLV
jgi:hypothetical protein